MKNEDNENTVYISAEEMEVISDEEITEIAGPIQSWHESFAASKEREIERKISFSF
jgi:hypothetical protein